MNISTRKIVLVLAMAGLMWQTGCKTGGTADGGAIHLLNGNDLNGFYTFLKGIGTNNDADKVFTMNDGVLRISGQHYGYIATKQSYADYRLVAEFKWGDVTWGGRQFNARDSGILVNMQGNDGVWPKSIECQMIEGGTGDILVVSGAYLTVDGVTKGPRIERFDRPGRNPWKDELGFRGPNEIENPHGQWNTLEVINVGGEVSITVNGHKTLAGVNSKPSSGKILMQSEGAEVFFRRLDMYPMPKGRSTKRVSVQRLGSTNDYTVQPLR